VEEYCRCHIRAIQKGLAVHKDRFPAESTTWPPKPPKTLDTLRYTLGKQENMRASPCPAHEINPRPSFALSFAATNFLDANRKFGSQHRENLPVSTSKENHLKFLHL